MGATELTRAACDALEREARSTLDNSCSEYVLGQKKPDKMPDYVEQHRQVILGCAEVIGAVTWAKVGWDEKDGTTEVEFFADAKVWLGTLRRETADHVDELDRSGEGDRDYNAGEVFLLHVLDRVLGSREPAMAGAS